MKIQFLKMLLNRVRANCEIVCAVSDCRFKNEYLTAVIKTLLILFETPC